MKGAADSKQGVSSWLTVPIPLFNCFWLTEREEGSRKLVAPCSPALLPDYLKQAQTQSQPLKPFFKPPPFKLVWSVLLLSDPHPSILCSSAFSFSASSLTRWLYQFTSSLLPVLPLTPVSHGIMPCDFGTVTPTQPAPGPRSPDEQSPTSHPLSLPLFAGREKSGFVHISRTFSQRWPEDHSLAITLYWQLIS